MDSIGPAKKRKADSESVPPRPGNGDAGTTLPANFSDAELHRLIDQRVKDALEAVEMRTLALASRVDGLQRENEELLLRCESLERSVQVLKKEGNWTYSAPDVPRSHWIDQGHEEEYAEEAGNLIQSIKDTTHRLRSGGGDEVLVGCDTRILPDNALDPHWGQLVNAIQLSEHISSLNFINVQLDERTLQMIEASVRNKGITRFYLDDNQFRGDEGVQFAIDVLKNNRTVGKFSWEDHVIHSTEDACKLVDAVLEHPTISDIFFTSSFREGITTYSPVKRLFCGLGTDTLLNVYLGNNGIETNGDRCIPDFLSKNPPLESLYLWDNRLNDDDALHIAVALQSNTNLIHLSLNNNELTENGKSIMYYQSVLGVSPLHLSALQSISGANLNSVSGANQTCEIVGVSKDEIMNVCDRSASWNRRRKLFWMLAERHRKGLNMTQIETEFSEDGLGVLPLVLACINTYAKAYSYRPMSKFNLSLLFELTRDWKTPEMYQLHYA